MLLLLFLGAVLSTRGKNYLRLFAVMYFRAWQMMCYCFVIRYFHLIWIATVQFVNGHILTYTNKCKQMQVFENGSKKSCRFGKLCCQSYCWTIYFFALPFKHLFAIVVYTRVLLTDDDNDDDDVLSASLFLLIDLEILQSTDWNDKIRALWYNLQMILWI